MIIPLLISLINLVYYALLILFIARMVFVFARVDPYHPTWGKLMRLTFQLTEPILQPIRNILPAQSGLDLSPLIVLLGLWLIRSLLIGFA